MFFASSIALLSLFSGCAKYVQIIYTAPMGPNIKVDKRTDNTFYVYEDSIVKIVYYFWAEGGVMSFEIYNKLQIPIYIDWKKSSYIANNVKNDYYAEKEVKASSSVSSTYLFNRPADWYSVFIPITATGTLGNETAVKEERVTFVPPMAWLPPRLEYKIIVKSPMEDHAHFNLKNAKEIAGASATSYSTTADSTNSPVFFRNFITYSTKENFEKEYYINNSFYIKEYVTMLQKYNGSGPAYFDYKDGRNFYLPDIDRYDLFGSGQ